MLQREPMTITKIEVWNFSPSFRDGSYAMSHVTQAAAYGRILRFHDADGLEGLGEIVFAPSLSQAARRRCIADEREYLSRLVGQGLGTIVSCARELSARGKPWRGVAFGIETACFDLQARQQGRSLAALLGGSLNDAVPDYFSISERSVERVRQRLEIAGRDRAVIQLKLGVGSLEDDIAQLCAALDVMTERQTLLADANGGWSVGEACEVIARFDDPRVIWEEPCTAYEENVAVARASRKHVMFDQCVSDIDAAVRAAEDGMAEAVCIKPAFLGGLNAAREVRDRCTQAGMNMRVDGPWCGDIATAAILHLAVGAPPELLVAGCDLREPLMVEPVLNGVMRLRDGRIAPLPGPGLGFEDTAKWFAEPEAVYALR
jgi:L-alanine-DL-glutamate epimerase-like enolase superfamily enzyme